MSEERKQCTQCKHFLLFEDFKTNQRTGQLTKMCIKCLETKKLSVEKNKCDHGRQKSTCKECGGKSFCEHRRRRSQCKDCRGAGVCEHDKIRSICKDCRGSQICEHNRIRSQCKDCNGGSICVHKKQRRTCPICNPAGHLAGVVSARVRDALRGNKEMSSQEYLGCDILTFQKHIESQFTEGMSWKNYGSEWHIDHKLPLKYQQDGQPPTLEEVGKRLHYLNTQPMWASENIAKGNRFISE